MIIANEGPSVEKPEEELLKRCYLGQDLRDEELAIQIQGQNISGRCKGPEALYCGIFKKLKEYSEDVV